MDCKLLFGDCLDVLKSVESGSVDMVLADLPYGTTACKWDSVIPFEPLWAELNRVTKPNAAMVMFGSEPFSTALRAGNIKAFKYDWVWYKNTQTGIGIAKHQPMRAHEVISVFCRGQHPYNKQPTTSRSDPKYFGRRRGSGSSRSEHLPGFSPNDGREIKSLVNPRSVLEFDVVSQASKEKVDHSTQKPVALLEYLIKTYTNEGDTVLDPAMGSGSTGVACKNLNRKFIGIEKDAGHFETAQRRINETRLQEELGALK